VLNTKNRKVLWKILLHKQKFDNHQIGKVWLLGSGAANLLDMEHNRDYYFKLRDSIMQYPNPCFNQIELDLKRTYPLDPPEKV